MNVLRTTLLFAVVLACCACGGQIGGVTEIIEMNPAFATVQVNEAKQLQVILVETGANEIEWSVVEAGGGTIDPDPLPNPPVIATYSAPATPGTYHVRAHVITNSREKTVECVMTVVP